MYLPIIIVHCLSFHPYPTLHYCELHGARILFWLFWCWVDAQPIVEWMDEWMNTSKEKGVWEDCELSVFFQLFPDYGYPIFAQSTLQDTMGKTYIRHKCLLVYSFSAWLYLYIYKPILCVLVAVLYVNLLFHVQRACVRRNLDLYLWHHDRTKSDEAELHPVEAVFSMSGDYFSHSLKKSQVVV